MSGADFVVRVDIRVPSALPSWVAARLRVSDARARKLVIDAVRAQAQLITKSAEILLGAAPPLLTFVSNFAAYPRDGDRWFECGAARARRMVNGKAIDDEEHGT